MRAQGCEEWCWWLLRPPGLGEEVLPEPLGPVGAGEGAVASHPAFERCPGVEHQHEKQDCRRVGDAFSPELGLFTGEGVPHLVQGFSDLR